MLTNKRLFSGFSMLLAAALLLAACKGTSGSADPEVVSVTIDPVTAEVSRGDSKAFTVTVQVLGGASAEVTWDVTGKDGDGVDPHADTRIVHDEADTATLYVAADEPAAVLIVTVRSKEDPTKRDEAVVTLNSGPYVSKVVIDEGGVIHLNQGKTYTLHAAVEGPGLTEPDRKVTWTIKSAHKDGTSIDADGVLTVAGDEPLGDLVVRAASEKNPAKFAEITVKVLDKNAPAVVSIIVSAEGDPRAGPGGTLKLTATVTVENGASKDVAWTLAGNGKSGTALAEDPADTNKATLTVASDETAATLTVTAASTVDGFTMVNGSIKVSVTTGAVYLIGDDFGGWPETPGSASGAAMTKGPEGGATWTWTGMMRQDKTFKFHDDTITGWDNGIWYVANGDTSGDVSTAGAGSKTVTKAPASGTGNSWKTAADGNYTITLDTAALTVTFAPIPEVTGITVNGPATVVLGKSATYTADVTVTHGASQAVTWSVTGNAKSGTAINAAGVLTVASDETAATLTVAATSTLAGFTDKKGSKDVTVANGAVYLIGNDFPGGWADPPGATTGQPMDATSGNVFTWNSVQMTADSTFKFHDDTITGWDNGTWYVANGDNSGDVSTAGTSPKTVVAATASGSGNAWQTAATGKYKIELNTATEKVTFTPIPEVISITVSGPATVVPGQSGYIYTADVTVTHTASKAVIWTVTGRNASDQEVPVTSGTGIVGSGPDNNTGTLTVAIGETAAKLVVTATSTLAGFTGKTDSITVPVGFGEIYLIGDDFGGWPSSGDILSTSGVKMTKTGNTYTWTGTMKRGSGFKFHDDTITGYADGNWFNAPSNDKATTDDTHSVGITVGSDTGKDWKTSHGGQYTITLNTVASTVTFASTQQTVAITNPVAGLAPGETHTFNTTLTGVTAGPEAAVTWTVTGGGIEDGSSPTGTTITAGLLNLGSGEWVGSDLTITATTALKETDSTTVRVIDGNVWLVGDMNSWGNTPGTLLTKTGEIFTWTGLVTNSQQFRFAVSDNSDSTNWDRNWLVSEASNLYWINSGNIGNEFTVDRYNFADDATNRGWYFDNTGDGNYTLTYNAVTRKLTVAKNP